ncbi:MAG: carboxymuconolactone decarboxylase family protein [Candidatus Methanoperedens sp.]|nr:carboxymuconolactone decarboxylase family protein [Candidatus Methanoperedens sp.]
MKKFSESLTSFIQKYPEVWEAHEKTGNLIHTSGPLDKKTCHLIQLGIAASAQLRGAVRSHATQAFEFGVTPEEIYHTVLLTLNTVGFPKMIMTYSWVRELLERLENEEH